MPKIEFIYASEAHGLAVQAVKDYAYSENRRTQTCGCGPCFADNIDLFDWFYMIGRWRPCKKVVQKDSDGKDIALDDSDPEKEFN